MRVRWGVPFHEAPHPSQEDRRRPIVDGVRANRQVSIALYPRLTWRNTDTTNPHAHQDEPLAVLSYETKVGQSAAEQPRRYERLLAQPLARLKQVQGKTATAGRAQCATRMMTGEMSPLLSTTWSPAIADVLTSDGPSRM